MKFLIVLAAVFAFANCDTDCTSSTKPNLEDDIQDITKLIPVSKIKALVVQFLASDLEVQNVVAYMKGKEFAALVDTVNKEKEVIALYTFLCSNGVPIYEDIKYVNDLLGLPGVKPPTGRAVPSDRTFRKFLDEVEALMPLDQLKQVFEQKVKTSAIFKTFYDNVSGKDFRAMVYKIYALDSVKEYISKLKALGADIDLLVKLMKELLGWEEN